MSEALKRNYEVGPQIGRGRFGTVYRCSSSISGDSYALKSVDKSLLTDPVDLECVEREAKFTQLVSGHPNVVQIHDVYEDDASIHLVLELCSGPDLFERIAGRPVLSEQEAAELMRPLMEAIDYCHRCGVAHRDIKPENVLFNSRNQLKLADFGSADWFGDGRRMSGLVGTPYYAAPEVVAGAEYGDKVDVWSAGVILYILLAGVPPFLGESAVEIFEAVMRANLRFPTRIFHGVSPAAKDLIRKMLCKDVNRRFTAEQVLRHPWITSCGVTRPMDGT